MERWTRQLWTECTRPSRIFTTTVRRFSVASSGGSVVGNTCKPCWCSSQERRDAENLSETVTASPRVLQRFLTEARWDDDAVIGRLQEYLCSRLEHPQAVWVLDGSDFPKPGVKSAGHPLINVSRPIRPDDCGQREPQRTPSPSSGGSATAEPGQYRGRISTKGSRNHIWDIT